MAARGAKMVIVNPVVHRRLKVLAAKEGTTIQALVDEVILRLLAEREE